MISLIVAHDKNRVIGLKGWMPWNLKEDLQQFKEKTLNHKIVMGRTTFEGLKKPLKNRYTYVVTHKDIEIDPELGEVVHDLDELVKKYKNSPEELIICGGGQIYKQVIDHVDRMYISLVDGEYDGDSYFPEYDIHEFVVEDVVDYEGFKVITYERKR